MADLVFTGRFNFDLAIGVCGAARIGVVAEAVLGAQFAIDAVEDAVEFTGGVGEEHSAAHGVRYGLQGVLTGGITAAFVFYGTNDNGVKQRTGAHGRFSSGIEIGAAGSFAGVGDKDDDAAAIFAAVLEGARGKQDGIVDGSSCSGRHAMHSTLQERNVVGKCRKLGDVFVHRENRHTVARSQHLADEMRGGFLLKGDFLVGAEAGIDHQREVQRQLRFGLEDFNLLLDAFFEELEGFARQIGRGAIVFVEHADEDVDEIHVDANAAALRCAVLRIIGGGGLACWHARALGFLRPGRTVGLVLREARIARGRIGAEQRRAEHERKQAGCIKGRVHR